SHLINRLFCFSCCHFDGLNVDGVQCFNANENYDNILDEIAERSLQNAESDENDDVQPVKITTRESEKCIDQLSLYFMRNRNKNVPTTSLDSHLINGLFCFSCCNFDGLNVDGVQCFNANENYDNILDEIAERSLQNAESDENDDVQPVKITTREAEKSIDQSHLINGLFCFSCCNFDGLNVDGVQCFNANENYDNILDEIAESSLQNAEGDENDDVQPVKITTRESEKCIDQLSLYFMRNRNKNVPTTSLDVCAEFINKQSLDKLQQRRMDDFLLPNKI
ncbi:Hypothetical protein CINCED_3A007618, partial [Cinara cedri]